MEKVPCKPEGSLKWTRAVTMTTIWAAPTRHPHTENLSGEKCADIYQKTSKGKEGLGAKEAKATCTARESNVNEVIDLSKSIVQLLLLKSKTALLNNMIGDGLQKTSCKHCLVFNLA